MCDPILLALDPCGRSARWSARRCCLGAFVVQERRSSAPLVRLGILRSSSLVPASLGAMPLFGGWVWFQLITTRDAPRPTAPLLAGRAELIDDGVRGNQPFVPGAVDLASRIEALAERLTDSLKPLAAVAYNYRWSWAARRRQPSSATSTRTAGSSAGREPGALPERPLAARRRRRVERNAALRARIDALAAAVAADIARPPRARPGVDGPVAFFCAEFGVPRLDADLLGRPRRPRGRHPQGGERPGAADDRHRPLLPARLLPAAARPVAADSRSTGSRTTRRACRWRASRAPDGSPLDARRSSVGGEPIASRSGGSTSAACRCSSSTPSCRRTTPSQRWTTAGSTRATAPCGSPSTALLGIGGARVLRRARDRAGRHPPERGPSGARRRSSSRPQRVERGASRRGRARVACASGTVFTTHTPVPAGNETYSPAEFLDGVRRPRRRLGHRRRGVPRPLPRRPRATGRAARDDAARDQDEPPPQRRQPAARRGRARDVAADVPGLRARRRPDHARHERRARPDLRRRPDARAARPALGDGLARAAAATRASGRRCATIPNEELWAARCEARAELVDYVASEEPADRLQRGEQIDYVRAIETGLDPDALTLGFARRLATYKRVHLLTHDPDRALPHPHGRAARAARSSPARRTRTTRPARTCSSASSASSATDAEIADRVVDRRGLRPRRRRAPRLRLRRLDQPAAAADGGERHERHEGDVQRRAPAQRARRLVGRGVRRRRTAGRSRATRTATRASSTPATPSASTTCSSAR